MYFLTVHAELLLFLCFCLHPFFLVFSYILPTEYCSLKDWHTWKETWAKSFLEVCEMQQQSEARLAQINAHWCWIQWPLSRVLDQEPCFSQKLKQVNLAYYVLTAFVAQQVVCHILEVFIIPLLLASFMKGLLKSTWSGEGSEQKHWFLLSHLQRFRLFP